VAWRNEKDVDGVAKVLIPLLEGCLDADSEQHRKFYIQTLKWPCRYLERFITPEVSKSAQLEAEKEAVGNIVSKADIAWILKSEDKLLTKHGFRSKRPCDPWDAYIQSGIEKAD